MNWENASDIAGVVSAAMAVIAGGVAAFALLYARRQIRSGTEIARETTALTAYREYLRLCVEHPEFSCSSLALAKLKRTNWQGVLKNITPDSERYMWVLSTLLNTCELVLTAEPDQRQWRSVLLAQLSYHIGTLEEVWPAWQSHYGREMRALVEEALRIGGAEE